MYRDLLAVLAGMVIASFFCAWRWERGAVYRYLPPAYGLMAGILLAVLWHTSAATFVETVAGFVAAGWVFWFAVWVQVRNPKRW